MPVNTGNKAEVNPDFPGNKAHSLYSRKPFHGLGEDSVFDIKMQGTLQLKIKRCEEQNVWNKQGMGWKLDTHLGALSLPISTYIFQ